MAEGLVYGPDEGWLMEGSSGGLLRLGGIPLGSSELWMPPPLRVIVSAHGEPIPELFRAGLENGVHRRVSVAPFHFCCSILLLITSSAEAAISLKRAVLHP